MVLSRINLHIKLYGYKSRFISFFLCFPDDSSYVALQEELSFHVYPQRLEDVVDHCVVVGDLVDVGSVQLHCVEGRKQPLLATTKINQLRLLHKKNVIQQYLFQKQYHLGQKIMQRATPTPRANSS